MVFGFVGVSHFIQHDRRCRTGFGDVPANAVPANRAVELDGRDNDVSENFKPREQ